MCDRTITPTKRQDLIHASFEKAMTTGTRPPEHDEKSKFKLRQQNMNLHLSLIRAFMLPEPMQSPQG